jgi:hypothetical protein
VRRLTANQERSVAQVAVLWPNLTLSERLVWVDHIAPWFSFDWNATVRALSGG